MEVAELVSEKYSVNPALAPTMSYGDSVYEEIDLEELARLSKEHAWLVNPICKASDYVVSMPFFTWLNSLNSPVEFGDAAKQLYHHSATFPKAMGLMLSLTSMANNNMMPFYAKHAYGESDHSAMLASWMKRVGIIQSLSELDDIIVTPETNACVNYAYQMALYQDHDGWLAGLNSGIERCSNDFFKAASPVMHRLGVGDMYFDVHIEADEHHSIMGLAYIDARDPESAEGRRIIAKALEGIALWAAMLHSWIGIDAHPSFNLDGSIAPRKKLEF